MTPPPGYHSQTAAIRWLIIGIIIGVGILWFLGTGR